MLYVDITFGTHGDSGDVTTFCRETVLQVLVVLLKKIVSLHLSLHFQQWSDYRLRWDPKEIGVETIRLPVSKIWAPDIAFFNE